MTFSRGYDKKGAFFIQKKDIIAEPKGIFYVPGLPSGTIQYDGSQSKFNNISICGIYDRKQ